MIRDYESHFHPLLPQLGREVYAYLVTHFGDIVSEETTRSLEEKLDQIEQGLSYQTVLEELHTTLKKIFTEP